uniref:Zinc-ribbon domain-containing protein n=1 Tax=uncultured Bacillota bacterium TaxID=344338 RepID=A0A650EP31_9FIRM|nr:hypothetical protein Firmicute1046_0540 [uncultured Firmicutes bacterium]
MALIKCPECGKEVSDSAKVCLNCGYPIAETYGKGEVKINIKFKVDMSRMVNMIGKANLFAIYNIETEEKLWSGIAGELVILEIDDPLKVGIMWGRYALDLQKAKEVFARQKNHKGKPFDYNLGVFLLKKNDNYVIENGTGYFVDVPEVKKVDTIV